MKIKNIKLENFKFHHNLEFDIKNQNCLIYGENGTGKSSIYKALYSNFYFFKDQKIINRDISVKDKFVHRDFSNENLKVNIDFNNELSLDRIDDTLENTQLIENKTIYFSDEKVLHKIVQSDFYQIINDELIKHFSALDELDNIYLNIISRINRSKANEQEEIINERQNADTIFKNSFNELIPKDNINKIINDDFNERFEIEFEIQNSDIQFYNKKFISPKIFIKIKNIDDRDDFKNHFNEAKLKLISIAIYFSLAKKFEIENSNLKLLVLDDFLTSLDMANRKLIMQYIFQEFKDYQIIIFTHNLQFYNIILQLLKSRDELKNWDIKNIFLRTINKIEESIIYDKQTNYLQLAQDSIDNNHLSQSGHYLRKEFERIVEELRKINEIGAKEKLSNIIEVLIKKEANQDTNIKKMQQILIKTKFYQTILMNPSSHNDIDSEIYEKECNGGIVILKQLNKLINIFKKEKYE